MASQCQVKRTENDFQQFLIDFFKINEWINNIDNNLISAILDSFSEEIEIFKKWFWSFDWNNDDCEMAIDISRQLQCPRTGSNERKFVSVERKSVQCDYKRKKKNK